MASKGDLVDWSEASWDLKNMIKIDLETKEVCKILDGHKTMLLPGSRSIADTKLLCRQIGGRVTVVRDKTQQDSMVAQFQDEPRCQESNQTNKQHYFPNVCNVFSV